MNLDITLPKPFDWQTEVLNNKKRMKMLIVGRQAGKTTLAQRLAILGIVEGKKVLWGSPAFHYSTSPCKYILSKLNTLLTYKNSMTHQYEFKTGGSLTIRSGDNPDSFRSLNFDLAILDEYAWMEEDCWSIIRPVLSVRKGSVFIITTPDGMNHAYELFSNAKKWEDWATWQMPSSINPMITKKELDDALIEVGDNRFRQEYNAEFVSKRDAIFDPSYFDNILISEFPINDNIISSFIGVDASYGLGEKCDYSSICYAGGSATQMIYVDCNLDRRDMERLLKDVKQIGDYYKPTGFIFESNTFQSSLIHRFRQLYAPLIPPPTFPMHNNINKTKRIQRLAPYLARKMIKIKDNKGGRLLVRQMREYPAGDFDDGPDSLELAIRGLYTL